MLAPRRARSFTDAFARANGVLGGHWAYNAGIWTIASGAAVCTPTLGAEIAVDANMEGLDTSAWTATNATLAKDTAAPHGGLRDLKITATANGGNATQALTLTVGTWYGAASWGKATSGDSFRAYIDDTVTWAGAFNPGTGTGTAYAQNLGTFRAVNVGHQWRLVSQTNTDIVWFDDLILKPLTLSSLFASIPFSSADVTIQVAVTRVAGCQTGVVLNLDNPANPANFVIGYLDGAGNCNLDKCVAGTYTNVITGAVSYSAGQLVKVVKTGTTYKLYYNGTQVDTDKTISGAGVVSNRYHGMFSTNSGNSLDSFSLTR